MVRQNDIQVNDFCGVLVRLDSRAHNEEDDEQSGRGKRGSR